MGKFKTSRYYYWSAICLAIVLPAHSHPKGSKSSSQYDQKQTGDYNIQLHLKDFQIIAMVPDDSFGALGDYEYNYDYSDFTVKPPGQQPSSSSENPSSTTLTQSSDDQDPYANISLTSTTNKPSENKSETTAAVKPSGAPEPSPEQPAGQIPVIVLTNPNRPPAPGLEDVEPADNDSPNRERTTTGIPEKIAGILASSASPLQGGSNFSTPPFPHSPQKATKIESVKVLAEDQDQQTEPVITNISIVPSEDLGYPSDHVTLGEILHYRKCATGYSRDKRGRCRKVRRPAQPLPFGITRFASNLAAKFRQATGELVDQHAS